MLVEQQIAESKSVVARPKRIKILLRSADFLWPLDSQTARSYFIEAFANAKEHFKEKGFEQANVKASGSGGSKTFTTLPDMRTDVIKAVGKRDAELAKKFADEVLAEFEKASSGREGLDRTREQDDLLAFAADIAATDPELSRHFFRRVMKYPITQSWFWSLTAAARSNQAFADSIYAEAVRNYRNEKPSRLLVLSAYPFGATSTFGRSRSSFSSSPFEGFVPNPDLQRLFLETFFARIAAFTASPAEMNQPPEKYEYAEPIPMVTALRDFEPIVMERFPELLEQFGVARAQVNAALTGDMRNEIDNTDKNTAGQAVGFEARIKALEEAETKGKLTDTMIAQIVFSGRMGNEDEFKTYEPWIAKIKDEKLRGDVAGYFWFLRARLATKEKRYADTEKFAAKVPELDHRAILLFEIAKIQLDSANDAASGFEVLNGVSKLTRSAPNSVAKARILFNLSQYYERVNHSTALDELGEAIRVVNQLEDPDIFTNTVFRQIMGKDFGFMTAMSLPGNNFESMFTALGKKDFEISLANARSLDDKYFKTLAVIAIAKNCIQPAAAPKGKK
jgi:tetratricopeptide (TPR) repeat protein